MIVVYVLVVIAVVVFIVGLIGWIASLIKAKMKHEWCNILNNWMWTILASSVVVQILNAIVQVNRILS